MLNRNMTLKEYRDYFADRENHGTYHKMCHEYYEELSSQKGKTSAFCFVMAVLLGGISASKDNLHTRIFLEEIYVIGENGSSGTGKWAQNVNNVFGDKTNSSISTTVNKLIAGLSEHLTIDRAFEILRSQIISLKNKKDSKFTKDYPDQLIGECLKKILTPPAEDYVIDQIQTGGCRQIIFTGAPGTGKTFIAKKIAKNACRDGWAGMLPNEKTNSETPYTLVQFHPSYDYTDFVEGLRPVTTQKQSNPNQIDFAKVDGTFKSFCRKVVAENKKTREEKTNAAQLDFDVFSTDLSDDNTESSKKLLLDAYGYADTLRPQLCPESIEKQVTDFARTLKLKLIQDDVTNFSASIKSASSPVSVNALTGWQKTLAKLKPDLSHSNKLDRSVQSLEDALTSAAMYHDIQNLLAEIDKQHYEAASGKAKNIQSAYADLKNAKTPLQALESLTNAQLKIDALRKEFKNGNQTAAKKKANEIKNSLNNSAKDVKACVKTSADAITTLAGILQKSQNTAPADIEAQITQSKNTFEQDIAASVKTLRDALNGDDLTAAIKEATSSLETALKDGTWVQDAKKLAKSISKELAAKTDSLSDDVFHPDKTKYPLYFFIIDEINRANLSKVFGELMYCLEKDKRGAQHAVQTQYQKLPTYDLDLKAYLDDNAKPSAAPAKDSKKDHTNCFADGFYIPANVVVIGTMNDIDRSVDSMDFALRRRFEWKEFVVTKVSLCDAFCSGEYDSYIKENADLLATRIMALNAYLEKMGSDYGLNRQYFISQGHFANLPDYFAKQDDPVDATLKYVWDYRIESLLREYLRGEDESKIVEFIGYAAGENGKSNAYSAFFDLPLPDANDNKKNAANTDPTPPDQIGDTPSEEEDDSDAEE